MVRTAHADEHRRLRRRAGRSRSATPPCPSTSSSTSPAATASPTRVRTAATGHSCRPTCRRLAGQRRRRHPSDARRGQDFAVIHYHRPAGDYGDPTVVELQRLLGHARLGRCGDAEPGVDRASQADRRSTTSGLLFRVAARRRGDRSSRTSSTAATTKDPGPDQFLDLVELGHEVWYLSGHVDAENNAKYLLPIQAGSRARTRDLARQEAHWLTAGHDRLGHRPGAATASYALQSRRPAASPSRAAPSRAAQRSRSPGAGRPDRRAQDEVAAPRRYQAFRIAAGDLEEVADVAEGPVAVSASDADGQSPDRDRRSRSPASWTTSSLHGDLGVSWQRRRADGPPVGTDREVRRAAACTTDATTATSTDASR